MLTIDFSLRTHKYCFLAGLCLHSRHLWPTLGDANRSRMLRGWLRYQHRCQLDASVAGWTRRSGNRRGCSSHCASSLDETETRLNPISHRSSESSWRILPAWKTTMSRQAYCQFYMLSLSRQGLSSVVLLFPFRGDGYLRSTFLVAPFP